MRKVASVLSVCIIAGLLVVYIPNIIAGSGAIAQTVHAMTAQPAPLGKALLGRKAGDEVSVTTEEGGSYTVRIKSITKEDDNGDGPIL